MCGLDHVHLLRLSGRPPGERKGGYRHITPQTVVSALALAQEGLVLPLNLSIETETIGRPNLVHRARMHNQTRPLPDGRFNVVNDDTVDLALQSHSHWDALAHWGVIEPGSRGVFYGDTGLDETWPEFGAKTLGMGALSGGIVTRGVLFDMVEHIEHGESTYLRDGHNIDAAAVRSWMERKGLTLHPGDAVIFYTGFQHRLAENPGSWGAGARPETRIAAGLLPEALPIFEAGKTFALVADNPSVEPNPMGEGVLHAGALKRLGIYLGELFFLEDLVQACRERDRWEFTFTSVPLNIPKAFGSPANALAIL